MSRWAATVAAAVWVTSAVAVAIPLIPPSPSAAGDDGVVTRAEWGAMEARGETPLSLPAPMVVLHHTYEPGACHDRDTCSAAMRAMQHYHMDEREWFDIGYNWCVGGDGRAYEGRGWALVGAHAQDANERSIGICLIGDWDKKVPPARQLAAAWALMRAGVSRGALQANYTLVGHRQVGDTQCPGDALYAAMHLFPHHDPTYTEIHADT